VIGSLFPRRAWWFAHVPVVADVTPNFSSCGRPAREAPIRTPPSCIGPRLARGRLHVVDLMFPHKLCLGLLMRLEALNLQAF